MKKFILLAIFYAGMHASSLIAQTFPITFIVDMNDVTEAYTTPEVNGTFNGWCGGCAPMSDADGDNIWELVIDLAPGFYEYKFAADTWSIQESLTPGDPCTMTTDIFTNRIITVTSAAVLDTVCWGSCTSCLETLPEYTVLFKVDMSEVTESFTTPEVNGTFNSWCGGCAPMSDADGDDIWELAITLTEGSYEYKFAADSWSIQEELTVGDPCTVTTDAFTNRFINVTADVTLDPVCWGACTACSPVIVENVSASALIIWPQPANDVLYIQSTNAMIAGSKLLLFDINGKVVLSTNVQSEITAFQLAELPQGVYMLVEETNGVKQSATSVVIQ
ncbi:MAG: T9SS type A sorting domain-containing protein [Chitinophagales bacterium]